MELYTVEKKLFMQIAKKSLSLSLVVLQHQEEVCIYNIYISRLVNIGISLSKLSCLLSKPAAGGTFLDPMALARSYNLRNIHKYYIGTYYYY